MTNACASAAVAVRAMSGGTGDQCAEALGDALQMMVQALSQMHASMLTMEMKMEKTDQTVGMIVQQMHVLEAKLQNLERKLDAPETVHKSDQPPVAPSSPMPPTDVPPNAPDSASKVQPPSSNTPQELPQPFNSSCPVATPVSASNSTPAIMSSFVAAPSPASTQNSGPVNSSFTFHPPVPKPGPSVTAAPKPRVSSRSVPPRQLPAAAASSKSQPRALTPPVTAKRRSQARPIAPPSPVQRAALGRKLMKATQDGKAKECRLLLQQGADPNFCNRSKWTILHVAAMKAETDIVSLLLEKGANLNAKNSYGFTPLHLAARHDFTGLCACFLIYAGCSIDSRNYYGRTALHYAAECNNQASVRALVVGGAKKCLRDREGRSAYDLAKTDIIRRYVRF